jgi:hypothetical protein
MDSQQPQVGTASDVTSPPTPPSGADIIMLRPSSGLSTLMEQDSLSTEDHVVSNYMDESCGTVRSTTFGRVVEHAHKLEKKLSSGDLHSRLKTRKLLGVGETADGDVHRSKLSQILGHSEQLYTKLPRGLHVWLYINATAVSLLAAIAIVLPSYSCYTFSFSSAPTDGASDVVTSGTVTQRSMEHNAACRLQGAALTAFAVLLWNSLHYQTDRQLFRQVALASATFWSLQVVFVSISLLERGQWSLNSVAQLLVHRLLATAVSVYYCHALYRRPHRAKIPLTCTCGTSNSTCTVTPTSHSQVTDASAASNILVGSDSDNCKKSN